MALNVLTGPIIPKQLDGAARVLPTGYTDESGSVLPVFPAGDFDNVNVLLGSLGTFWSKYFEGKATLYGLLSGSAKLSIQTYIDWLETVACVSRFTTPIYNKKLWFALILRESEMDTGAASLLTYSEDGDYGDSYRYGIPINDTFHTVNTNIASISVITNKFVGATLMWTDGLDYFLKDNIIYFRSNPFDNNKISKTSIVDSAGNVVDREIVLWAFNSREDLYYLYNHYGYAIKKKLESSESYKSLINSIWDGFVGGLTGQDLEWFFCAVAGVPCVLDTEETVEQIIPHNNKLVITTNENSYIYPADSIASVAVNQVVRAGQCLVDTVSVFDLANFDDVRKLITATFKTDNGSEVDIEPTCVSSSDGNCSPSVIKARKAAKLLPSSSLQPLVTVVPLIKGMIGNNYEGTISFYNTRGLVDTSTVDNSGLIKAEIKPLAGSEEDIVLFWNSVHENGLSTGKTWYDLYGSVSWINPAGFVIDNFLRNNGIVVYLRYSRFSSTATSTTVLDLIRRVLPAEKVVIVIVDVEILDEEPINTEVFCESQSSSSATDGICNEVTECLLSDAGTDDIGSATDTVIYFAISECI